MILHTGRDAEAQLRTMGFDIPEFPKTGPVAYGGMEVGYADNFSGITIRDEFQAVVELLVDAQDNIKMAVWNIPAYAR